MIGIFVFLITGFWDLQIRNPDLYQEQAMENSIKSIPVLAPRGKILDRDGRVIVDNHSSFSLYLSRENLKMEHLKPIAEGLNLDYDSLVARVRRFQSRGAPHLSAHPDQRGADARRAGLRRFAQGRRHVSRIIGHPRTAPPVSARRLGRARHRLRRRGERVGIEHAGVCALSSGRRDRQGWHRAPV